MSPEERIHFNSVLGTRMAGDGSAAEPLLKSVGEQTGLTLTKVGQPQLILLVAEVSK
ncbi:hypothetical protein Fuma_05174 [Fuerstiella marisgermanici]|uniref:Uncharacterized protein n=1 Tax=Fuerstiella marisgermanici TaxID=1891926 RepID=A0A1P8WN88_9PLAN|nr:hypothetical protein Fuma_05174 [Fuerstiella marisgermanici]